MTELELFTEYVQKRYILWKLDQSIFWGTDYAQSLRLNDFYESHPVEDLLERFMEIVNEVKEER